jgi:hypothetical protein
MDETAFRSCHRFWVSDPGPKEVCRGCSLPLLIMLRFTRSLSCGAVPLQDLRRASSYGSSRCCKVHGSTRSRHTLHLGQYEGGVDGLQHASIGQLVDLSCQDDPALPAAGSYMLRGVCTRSCSGS